MSEILEMIPEPKITITELSQPELSDKKIGQQVRTICNFEVVEKTKSFTTLRLTNIYVTPTKRTF
jgi:hypothetical protein